ncbi:hypothetical protein BV898_09481 [Hypsibius exemplaris]|uniref:Receptor ligand binding region domain-containing protein n=1 Tax=Hypsibius exemplaris TaxID=2072580 RepID=A0A1W0WMA8_HYPEX|nr:hypothetical protein BV898_09481 [Hypsibius exemplaris]
MVTMIDLTVSTPPDLDVMMRGWVERYRAVPLYHNTQVNIEPPLPQLTSTTAALDIFGQVLEIAALDDSFDIRDGKKFYDRCINRTFSTSVGNVTFDRHGERTPLFVSTSYFDSSTGNFVSYLRSEIRHEDFQWVDLRSVRWHNTGSLPPSDPRCGYKGDECRKRAGFWYWLFLLLPILVVLLGVSVRIRQKRMKKHCWWQLDDKRLDIPSPVTALERIIFPTNGVQKREIHLKYLFHPRRQIRPSRRTARPECAFYAA